MAPVILLHGFAQTPASWNEVAAVLQKRGHRVCAVDLLGSARATLAQRNGEWAARLRTEGVEAFMDWWETLPLFATQRDLPAAVRAAIRAERTASDAETLARVLEAWGAQHQAAESDTLAALVRARDAGTPVLYVAGERDAKYCAVADRARAAGLPTAVIPNAGHNVHLERPDAFCAALA